MGIIWFIEQYFLRKKIYLKDTSRLLGNKILLYMDFLNTYVVCILIDITIFIFECFILSETID